MGKYSKQIKSIEDALKDKSGLSESQVKELEAGLEKFKELDKKEEEKPAKAEKPKKEKKAPKKKKNKSHKKAAEPAAPEKKKVKHKKETPKRKKAAEKRAEKKKNKSHKKKVKHTKLTEKRKKALAKRAEKKAAKKPAKKKAVHKNPTPKRANAIKKRIERKMAKATPKQETPKSVHHRIDAIVKDVQALKPEIAKMQEQERKETEEKMRERLRKTLAESFEFGGDVKGSGGFDLFEDILCMGDSKEEFKGGGKVGTKAAAEKKHPHTHIDKGFRLPHGTEAPKGDKNKKYSEGEHVSADKGHFVRGGLETVRGADKNKFYAGGGSPKKGGNPNFKPSYGIFTDKAKAEAQAKAKNGIVEVLKAKTVPAHTKRKKDKKTGEMREVHHKERHYPVRYMVKGK